jgi:hypothetical protein
MDPASDEEWVGVEELRENTRSARTNTWERRSPHSVGHLTLSLGG